VDSVKPGGRTNISWKGMVGKDLNSLHFNNAVVHVG